MEKAQRHARPVYSVEIGRRWRAIGVVSQQHKAVVWMFAGSHETYNNYIESHRRMTETSWLSSSVQARLEARTTPAISEEPKNPRERMRL